MKEGTDLAQQFSQHLVALPAEQKQALFEGVSSNIGSILSILTWLKDPANQELIKTVVQVFSAFFKK